MLSINIRQIQDYSSVSAGNHSAEVTTVSGPLLTDRILALRALEEVSSVLLTGLCRRAVIQYNATFEEMTCVCFGQCPWRAPTEQEVLVEYQEYRSDYHLLIATRKHASNMLHLWHIRPIIYRFRQALFCRSL